MRPVTSDSINFLQGVLIKNFLLAEKVSRFAKQEGNYLDYLNYVSCPVELAAHSSQLAVEVLDSYGAGLGRNRFPFKMPSILGVWTRPRRSRLFGR